MLAVLVFIGGCLLLPYNPFIGIIVMVIALRMDF